MEILIVDPISLVNVPLQEWKERENPQSADLIVIKTDEKELYISKNILPGRFDFSDAQKAAAAFIPARSPKLDFRCPTRKECIDIYDARFAGLDEAIELLGGEKISGHWYWTSEADPDPEYNSNTAFVFNGTYGTLIGSYKYGTRTVRPVSAFLNR